MDRVLLALGVLLMVGGCKQSGSTKPLSNAIQGKPVVTFNKQLIDLGNVQQDDEAGAFFWAKNTGTGNWVIHNVDAGCRCTTVNWPQTPVIPGDSARIDVYFNTRGMDGKQIKAITIIDNTEVGKQELAIAANVLINN